MVFWLRPSNRPVKQLLTLHTYNDKSEMDYLIYDRMPFHRLTTMFKFSDWVHFVEDGGKLKTSSEISPPLKTTMLMVTDTLPEMKW